MNKTEIFNQIKKQIEKELKVSPEQSRTILGELYTQVKNKYDDSTAQAMFHLAWTKITDKTWKALQSQINYMMIDTANRQYLPKTKKDENI